MSQDNAKSLSIHATPDRIHVRGDIEQDLRLLADAPLRSLLSRPTARGVDLLNVAAGVYAVDRVIKRKPGKGNDIGIRSLRLSFAVHDLAFWQRDEIIEAVTELLVFLTDENWSLSFESAAASPLPQDQLRLDLPWTQRPRRIALYSGGLDSAAGLASRVLAGVDDYLLVTVGHQSGLRHRCADQIQRLSALTQTTRQLHTTMVVALRGGAAKRISRQERSQRSRAFLFCATAAVVAQACEIEDIEVFENGVGAINLPLMTGMLAGGLATRGAHPTFLKLMSQLASAVAEKPIRYSLPFATQTKAEMLVPLKAQGLADWAQLSRSCVHTSWRERKTGHCGQCPGCIERRQAFAAAGIAEPAGQYSLDLVSDPKPLTRDSADYLRCYLNDAAACLANDPLMQRRLHWHLTGTQVPSEQHAAVAERQRRHAQEVINTLGHLSPQRVLKAAAIRRDSHPSISLDTSP
ncbi:7-cyano-7-deazaguanine synthase [Hydrocarboniphaga sp.]|uniref:7-cyano-7-deazaguanine synthase n=1 Tax=Hydrocarboniphaga sp. TaxID=2033016 RepID=UPI003D0D9426